MKKLSMGPAENRSLAEIASRLDFFTPLKGAELEQVLSHIQLFEFASREAIFNKGDPPDAFYIIHEGVVQIRLPSRWYGLIHQEARLGPGNLFGEMALLENRPRSTKAVARKGAKLFVLLRQDFDALMKRNPTFAEGVRWIAAQRKFQTAH